MKGSCEVTVWGDGYKDGGGVIFFTRDCSLKCGGHEEKIEKLYKVSFPTVHTRV